MPEWQFNSPDYRYTFNGKETDLQTTGVKNMSGTQDYGMRIYNPALGKFLSVDPLAKEYPWNSPYAFAENSVIAGRDLDGAELDVAILRKEDGKTKFERVDSEDPLNFVAQALLNNLFKNNPNGGSVGQTIVAFDGFTRAYAAYQLPDKKIWVVKFTESEVIEAFMNPTEDPKVGIQMAFDLWTGGGRSRSFSLKGSLNTSNLRGPAKTPSRSSELPLLKKGSPQWQRVVKEIGKLEKGKINVRVESATDAKNLLKEAKGNMNRYKNYTDKTYDKGYETHNSQNERELDAGNDLQHVKWKDNKAQGHIYYDKPN